MSISNLTHNGVRPFAACTILTRPSGRELFACQLDEHPKELTKAGALVARLR